SVVPPVLVEADHGVRDRPLLGRGRRAGRKSCWRESYGEQCCERKEALHRSSSWRAGMAGTTIPAGPSFPTDDYEIVALWWAPPKTVSALNAERLARRATSFARSAVLRSTTRSLRRRKPLLLRLRLLPHCRPRPRHRHRRRPRRRPTSRKRPSTSTST